ncbi:hypothetical protein [Paraburkholderia sp. GAS32]|uniref:hypothetical protein n=1 Tax=Paraburkholderia sp. GAS32 TaxID=3035129 RepID=UPI003D1F42F2
MSFNLDNMVDLDLEKLNSCDLLIVPQTSEPRGEVISGRLTPLDHEVWIIGQTGGVHAYDEEDRPNTALGSHLSVDSVRTNLEQWMRNRSDQTPTIVVDVSCMSRPIMAATFEAIFRAAVKGSLNVVVGYVIAAYSPPPTLLPPNEDIKPISEFFAGWPNDTTASTALIVGLGYERAKAEGACEYFDASETWVFVPRSPIREYDDAVTTNNDFLLARARRREHSIDYKVDSPTEALGHLATRVTNLLSGANLVLLPFGPKIFFVLSLLIGAIFREVGVWHVTGDAEIAKTYHPPSDKVVGFRMELSPRQSD